MQSYIKNIDLFSRPYEEFIKKKTKIGAIVSIASVFIMFIVFVTEFNYYLKTDIKDTLYVNTTWSEKLQVSFDISLPEIACSLISLDIVDETGLPQKGVTSEIYKHRLDRKGLRQGFPELHVPGDTIRSEKQLSLNKDQKLPDILSTEEKVDKCGNCYGSKDGCCNTCDDVKRAYLNRGWTFNPVEVKQCEHQVKLEDWKEQNSDDGGCQLLGKLELNRLSGHFHIAPHKKLQDAGNANGGMVDFLELISFTFSQFNVSHKINSLHFGHQYYGIKSPLDGASRVVLDTHGMHQYYLKIVPTQIKTLKGQLLESNQYAVTEHVRHLAVGSGRGLPGIYFYYEVSPVQAIFEEVRSHKGSFIKLLTTIFAIAGGSYTIFGLIDNLIIYALNFYKQTIV